MQVWPRWLLRETRDRPSLSLLLCSLHTLHCSHLSLFAAPQCSLPLIVHAPHCLLPVFTPLTVHTPHFSHLTVHPLTVHTTHSSRPLLFTPDCTWTSLFTAFHCSHPSSFTALIDPICSPPHCSPSLFTTPHCSQLPPHSRCSDSVSSATTPGENSCTSARTQTCGFPP